MWIIKNRVTGEYERKGMSGKRDKVNRHAWDTLGRAKCHVVYTGRFDEWFLDADFIEVTEDGIGLVIPVSDYLREHYSDPRTIRWMRDDEKNKLEKYGLLPEPPKESP